MKNDKQISLFNNEAKIMEKLTHLKVRRMVPYYGQISEPSYALVTEYQPYNFSTLLELNQLDWAHRYLAIEDILTFVADAHSHKVLHRDLKANNVLMSQDKLHSYVCDMAFAVEVSDITCYENCFLGTPGWAAPEICPSEGYTPLYSNKSDSYALGTL